MKNKVFVIGIIVAAAAVFLALKLFSPAPEPAPAPQTATAAVTPENFIRPHSPTFGNLMAKVTVIEWFDPQCESCRAFHPVVHQIMQDYKDRVRFVFRYMPYHAGSMYAASALEEARELGKFEEALNALFEHQPEWGDHHHAKPELIPQFLIPIGIPKEKFEQNLIEKHGAKIRQDEADGQVVGVNGTPTFFINGQMLRQLGEGPLRMAIEEALNSAK